jgi:hypothetical protein
MLIECTYGPVTTEVMGTQYAFAPDENGRFVTEVHIPRHIQVLLGASAHYRAVEKDMMLVTLSGIDPATAVLGDADFTLTCTGTGFRDTSIITFAGQPEPIGFISDTEITTIVKPSLPWGAVTVPVTVKNTDGSESAQLDFSFTEPVVRTVKEDSDDDAKAKAKAKAKADDDDKAKAKYKGR